MTPIALDPEQGFELVLESDRNKPEETRPTFVFRYLANRDWKRVAHVCDRIDELKKEGLEKMLNEMEAALKSGLVDWRNMSDRATGEEILFDAGELDRIVNIAEISELLFGVMEHIGLEPEDKKKFESPSPSDTDESARSADLLKPAFQVPQNGSQSSSNAPAAEAQESTPPK